MFDIGEVDPQAPIKTILPVNKNIYNVRTSKTDAVNVVKNARPESYNGIPGDWAIIPANIDRKLRPDASVMYSFTGFDYNPVQNETYHAFRSRYVIAGLTETVYDYVGRRQDETGATVVVSGGVNFMNNGNDSLEFGDMFRVEIPPNDQKELRKHVDRIILHRDTPSTKLVAYIKKQDPNSTLSNMQQNVLSELLSLGPGDVDKILKDPTTANTPLLAYAAASVEAVKAQMQILEKLKESGLDEDQTSLMQYYAINLPFLTKGPEAAAMRERIVGLLGGLEDLPKLENNIAKAAAHGANAYREQLDGVMGMCINKTVVPPGHKGDAKLR